jgi:hypothetical protein
MARIKFLHSSKCQTNNIRYFARVSIVNEFRHLGCWTAAAVPVNVAFMVGDSAVRGGMVGMYAQDVVFRFHDAADGVV